MGRAYGSGTYGSGIYEGTSFANEMNALSTRPILLLEVDFPSGTQYFSQSAVRFLSRLYRGKLLQTGSVRRAISQNLGLFEVASIEAMLADTDTSLMDLTSTDAIKGALARFKLGAQGLPLSLFETIFEGKIDDFGADNFAFRILVRDKFWSIPAKPDTGHITSEEFANCLPADLGKPIPVCYGTHSDTGTDDAKNRGAWPTLYVDASAGERTFLIAGHAVKDIAEVYAFKATAGSQLLVETTDYVAYPNGFIGSRRCAFIKLTSSGFAKLVDTNALGVLTVNVEGKEDAGDGSGNLITNPISILRDIFGNYLSSPELNGDKFSEAENVATGRSYIASGGYIEEQATDEFIKTLCDSFQIRLYPDSLGRIAADIFEPAGPGQSVAELREQWEILKSSFSVNYLSDIQGAEDSQIVNAVEYKFDYHWAKNIFRDGATQENAASITSYGRKVLNLGLKWSQNSSAAGDIAGRFIQLYKNPVEHFSATVPLVGMNLDLTDQVLLTHEDGPAGGFSEEPFEIIEHVFNPSNLNVFVRCKNISTISEGAYFLDDEESRVRVQDGTIAVTNGSADINSTGATSFITAGVQVGDIIEIYDPVIPANLKNLKITSVVDLNTVQTANTVWTNESGMSYRIIPSWLTATADQKLRGHLCDETTGEFSNGDDGFRLL